MAPGLSPWQQLNNRGKSPSKSIVVATAVVIFTSALNYLKVIEAANGFRPEFSDINIGAFNIRNFGKTKINNNAVMEDIVQVVANFDIIAIQEVRDDDKQVQHDVVKKLQKMIEGCSCGTEKSCSYLAEFSVPLGENSCEKKVGKCHRPRTERYAFLYRQDTVQVVGVHQYPYKTQQHPGGTGYARPPFAAHVRIKSFYQIPEFLFIVVHTRPQNAETEINNLKDVYQWFRQKTRVSNAIIGGDLNAGCTFWNDNKNTLTENAGFYWLIDSKTATNIATKQCPYDRFILVGKNFIPYWRKNSAGPYDYTNGNVKRAVKVSDHYPIGMRLGRIRSCGMSQSTRSESIGEYLKTREPPICPASSRI